MKLPAEVKKIIFLGFATTALVNCGSSNDKDPDTGGETQTIALSGTASKGIIKQGVVSIYKIEDTGLLGDQLATTPSEILTQDNGQYTAELAEEYEGPIKIIITPGASTTMVCDVVDGCDGVAFGSDLTLDANFKLSAVASAMKGDDDTTEVTTNVTPLTNIAAALLEETVANNAGVNVANAVTAANKKVAELFNLGTGVDVSEIEVVDITDAEKLKTVNIQAFQVAAISAAIAAKAIKSDGGLANFISMAAEDIAINKGTIQSAATTGNSENIISLADTLAEVNNINAKLQQKIIDKINNTEGLSDEEKAAAQAEVQTTFQQNTQISGAFNDFTAETQDDIDEANQSGSDRAGDELTVDDIIDTPTGPTLKGKLLTDTATLSEDGDTTIDVLVNDTLAIEGESTEQIQITSISQPENGTAEIVDGKVKYTPNADFNGADEFTYTVTVLEQTFVAKVKLNVTAVSDLTDINLTVEEDSSASANVIGSLSADSIASISIVTAPANGNAIVDGNQISYTPAADYNGDDQLVYKVTLTSGTSEEATINYTVTPKNDLIDADFTLDEDTSISTLSIGTYTPASVASISLVTAPTNGNAVIDGHKIIYTPNSDYHGTDKLVYKVTLTSGLSEEGTYNYTINSVSDLVDADLTLDEDTTRSELSIGSHNAENVDSISIVTQPTQGTATIADNKVTYTPNADYNGIDQLVYKVTLKSGLTEESTYNYTVNAVVDAKADTISTSQFMDANVNVLTNDTFKGQVASVKLLDSTTAVDMLTTSKGKVTITNDGVVSYSPIDDAIGSDSFSYQVTTDSGIMETAIVSVNIAANDATSKAKLMVEDMRTWGAYLFPDDFDGARKLVDDTEEMFEVLDAAAPVFEDKLSDITIVGDVTSAIEKIIDDINSGNTELTVFAGDDLKAYDDSLTGSITVKELMDNEASLLIDVAQGAHSLKVDAELVIPAEEMDDSTLTEKSIKAWMVGELDAGDTTFEFRDGTVFDIILAGSAHSSESQNEVLTIKAGIDIYLMQKAVDSLTQDVEFEGQLNLTLIKGQSIEVRIYDMDADEDNSVDIENIDLYLPTNASARGKFTTNGVNTFEANLNLTIANASSHSLPNGVEIYDYDDQLDLEFDIEDEDNWLNVTASLMFDINPDVESQGAVKLNIARDGYEHAILSVDLSDDNSELSIHFDSDNEDMVNITNNNGLVVTYNENGIGDTSGDIIIVAEIRSSEDNSLLATFEKNQDGLVQVYYTGTNSFETFF